MAWWKNRRGSLIGDGAVERIEHAVREIRELYKEELSRDARDEEIQEVLSFALLHPDTRGSPGRRVLVTSEEYLARYPRICAHIIAESLGYATPNTAALILKNAKEGAENWCEWVFSCYERDPTPAVENAIRNRHTHRGYMAEYRNAYAIVRRQLDTGESPTFASWF